jgi:hypothetical protein
MYCFSTSSNLVKKQSPFLIVPFYDSYLLLVYHLQASCIITGATSLSSGSSPSTSKTAPSTRIYLAPLVPPRQTALEPPCSQIMATNHQPLPAKFPQLNGETRNRKVLPGGSSGGCRSERTTPPPISITPRFRSRSTRLCIGAWRS